MLIIVISYPVFAWIEAGPVCIEAGGIPGSQVNNKRNAGYHLWVWQFNVHYTKDYEGVWPVVHEAEASARAL